VSKYSFVSHAFGVVLCVLVVVGVLQQYWVVRVLNVYDKYSNNCLVRKCVVLSW